MKGEISLIIDATRKASRFLQRDYFELENLQSSEKSKEFFAQKACTKAMQILHENLSKYFKKIIFKNDEVNLLKTDNANEKIILVETLDGLENFERSLPFFAIMVTLISNKNGEIKAEKSVINFPALGEIYYTEISKGAMLEKHGMIGNSTGASKMRISGTKNIKNAIISPSSSDYLNKALEISSNVRVFSSYTYSLAMFISGKIDIFVAPVRDISFEGVKLFISESRGILSVNSDVIFASNFELGKQLTA